MVIGLTGGIGSGKSTVINIFSEFENIAIYIADDEAKKLMNTSKRIKEQLITEFGEEVYINHKLNRPYLASIVFNNKKKLAILNAIVHPAVNKHLQQFLKKNSIKDYILYENAILFENGSDSFCDKIITITAPEHIRIERVIKRDRTTIQEVKNRIKNQWSETKKILQSNYLINNISLLKTKDEVLKIHNYLTKSRK
ncbi:dephospho-CoA kinase [Tenacibaculum mesophilum]|uniref:Dephospho-CoA kinase n=1 Tax=Tenacibaculum mesophilum TaxID=104268 RepID=A0ABN5T1R4_9FLAO|nr:dephospho-CoA kinase [Tenacibaculum mesophilum]AZJ31209.1 dephospho-CoA kinase [Tenacibaculum mesophilum]QFS29256.1 dephospho-CoA kinase [Tenacibaculum mesophilum]SHF49968.1 dephospho-CoA kinase [Tenacibaculum mesophilum]